MTNQLYKSNGIYTSFTSTTGRDCRTMEPETLCFCQHGYKNHKTDFDVAPKERPIKLPCRTKGCKCASFHYVPPLNCCTPLRCHCKHLAEDHSESGTFVCNKAYCTSCTGFSSSFICGCGVPVGEHKMTIETGNERETRRGGHGHQ